MLKEAWHDAAGNAFAKRVLILILMEHAQKGTANQTANALASVLILILMEHAQRD